MLDCVQAGRAATWDKINGWLTELSQKQPNSGTQDWTPLALQPEQLQFSPWTLGDLGAQQAQSSASWPDLGDLEAQQLQGSCRVSRPDIQLGDGVTLVTVGGAVHALGQGEPQLGQWAGSLMLPGGGQQGGSVQEGPGGSSQGREEGDGTYDSDVGARLTRGRTEGSGQSGMSSQQGGVQSQGMGGYQRDEAALVLKPWSSLQALAASRQLRLSKFMDANMA